MGKAIGVQNPKITVENIQQEAFIYAQDTGTANAYAIAQTPAPTIVAGSIAVVKIANANTGASTLAVNGGTATAITKDGTTALDSGDLSADQIAVFIFDGTEWQFIGAQSAASSFKPYHLVCGFPNTPAASVVVMWTCPGDLPAGVTFPGNFSNSSGRCLTLPTSSAVFTINKIPSGSTTPTAFGTVTISMLGVFTFATTGGSPESFAVGDSLTAVAPSSPDATLANVEFTLAGAR